MSADDFTPEERRILKTLAAGMLKAMARDAKGSNGGGGPIASDEELDSRYGDPVVRRDPSRWAGDSYVGANYSRCPSDYLTTLASFLEWKVEKESAKSDPKRHTNGTPYYEYDKKDAARARGWAERNRGKTLLPPSGAAADSGSDGYDQSSPDDWVP